MTPKIIGNAIKKARKKKGLTQNILASQINMTEAQVKFLESGRKKISDELLLEIEKVLGSIEINNDERISA